MDNHAPVPENACEVCSQPGACCRDFPLIGGEDSQVDALPTLLHAMVWAACQVYDPAWYKEAAERHRAKWRMRWIGFDCPAMDACWVPTKVGKSLEELERKPRDIDPLDMDPERPRSILGLPFIPHERGGTHWRWHCVNLLPNGRCGDYENRPYGPCVIYKPGDDRICTFHPDFGT